MCMTINVVLEDEQLMFLEIFLFGCKLTSFFQKHQIHRKLGYTRIFLDISSLYFGFDLFDPIYHSLLQLNRNLKTKAYASMPCSLSLSLSLSRCFIAGRNYNSFFFPGTRNCNSLIPAWHPYQTNAISINISSCNNMLHFDVEIYYY